MALVNFNAAGVRLAVVIGIGSATLGAQAPVATFTSGIDLVSVSAVVRDHKGRFVQNLSARDFEILDTFECGIVLKGSSDGSTARHFLDQIDDAAAQLAVLDAHEGLRQRQPVAGRKQAGGIIRGIALGKTGVRA